MQVEDRALDLDLAGFDPRVVEDVVENAEQDFARRAHDPDLLMLPLVERAVGHEPQHAENPVHRGADLMAHGGEELRLGAARLLGAGASAIVVAHLLNQPGIGLGQLRGPLRDQSLQMLLVLAQLGVGLFPLLLELLLDDGLVAEDPHRVCHVGELVLPAGRNGYVQAPRREVLHDPVQRGKPVDDVAMHVEPGDGARDGDEQHDLEQDGEAAELDGAVRRLGCVGSDLLRAGDDRGDTLVHPVRQRAVVVRQGGERRIEVQRPAALVEEADGAGRPVGRQCGDQPLPLLAADRVVDQGHAALQDAEVAAVALLDPADLAGIARAAELVQQQTLLGGAHPELEHPLQQEQIRLDQPVEGIQHGREACGVFGELVEIGDDNCRPRRRVGGECLGKRGELPGHIQRARDRGSQDRVHTDPRLDDLVLPIEVGRERRYHAPNLGHLLFGEAVTLQSIEAGGEQIGRGPQDIGLSLPLRLAFSRGEQGTVRRNLRGGLGDDPPLGDRRQSLVDDRRLRSVDVAQDDPADDPGCDGEGRHPRKRGEQAACNAEAAEHRESRTPVGIERQSAASCRP